MPKKNFSLGISETSFLTSYPNSIITVKMVCELLSYLIFQL
jgi:hypothetical protein